MPYFMSTTHIVQGFHPNLHEFTENFQTII